MVEPFLIFQSYNDFALVKEVEEILTSNGVPVKFDDTSSPIDPLIIGSPLEADIRLKIRPQDFEKANLLLQSKYKVQPEGVEKDYYLLDFTDQELLEILQKPDEWGSFDYNLAQKLLRDRNIDIKEEELQRYREQRIKELSKPETEGKSWIYLGYFIAIFFSPIGIFYGVTVVNFKKTLPNGQRVYNYSEKDRKHGKNILVISSVLTALWVVLRILDLNYQ